MKKGTAILLNSIKQMPGNAIANAGHNLGIAAKPVEKTTTREYMDLVSDIYFLPGAIEQIENTLNGRNDKKGPLSKVQRDMVMKNPTVSALVKKLCIEKAVSDVTESTSKSFFEGLNLSGTEIGKEIDAYKEFFELRDKAYKEFFGKRLNFKEFTSQFDNFMNVSIRYLQKRLCKVDRIMQGAAQKPKLEEHRAKAAKKIDQPTIAVMEKMNGSDAHVMQAVDFIDFMEGKTDIDSLLSGPYTYSELVRMAATQGSKSCVMEMLKLQDERKRNDSSRVFYPDKVTDDEKKRIDEAKKKSEAQMKGVTKKRNEDMKNGRMTSFSEYAESISVLVNDEQEAKAIYSSTVLNVNTAVANRMHVQQMKDRLDEVYESQKNLDEHYRAMEEIDKRAASMIHVEDILGEFEKVKEATSSSKSTTKEADGNPIKDEGEAR